MRLTTVVVLLLSCVVLSVGATLAAIQTVPALAPAGTPGAEGLRGPAGPPGERGVRGPRGPAATADPARPVHTPPLFGEDPEIVTRLCRVFQSEYLNREMRHPDVAALATELYDAC